MFFQHRNLCPIVLCHLRHDDFDATPVKSLKNNHLHAVSQIQYHHFCIMETTPNPLFQRFTRDSQHFTVGVSCVALFHVIYEQSAERAMHVRQTQLLANTW